MSLHTLVIFFQQWNYLRIQESNVLLKCSIKILIEKLIGYFVEVLCRCDR